MSIQNAYLHLTTKVEYENLTDSISGRAQNPKELNKIISETDEVQNNSVKKADKLFRS